MDAYASNETPNQAERKHSSKYSDANQAVWDWYRMCKNSTILVSSSALQEEVTLIAEKLDISDFVASNGWLKKFKPKYNICNKTVAGEAGDISKETMESWNEHAREITTGWNICSYFTNSKAWMNTKIMTTILSKLNRQLMSNDRHILLFMDNAPCHPQTLSGQFSNITVQFLPEDTTSKPQPLDAGIISH